MNHSLTHLLTRVKSRDASASKKNANITVSKDNLLSKNIFGSVRLYLKGGGDN